MRASSSACNVLGAAALSFAALADGVSAAEPSLMALDFSPTAVSADGSVVVGNRQGEAIRWTAAGGAMGLGTHPVAGVSADGSIIVGGAHRWTAQQGWVPLDGLPVGSNFVARSVSSDGSVIVGSAFEGGGGGGTCYWDMCTGTGGVPPSLTAFRWSAADGWTVIGGFENDLANAVSADGRVVVGSSYGTAFRWTAQTDVVGLGGLPPAAEGRVIWAAAVSGDGSVVAGGSLTNFDGQPLRWTDVEGTVGLDKLPGLVTLPTGISADGLVIIGGGVPTGYTSPGSLGGRVGYTPPPDTSPPPYPSLAVTWDADGHIRTLSDVLGDLGVDLTGWRLSGASAISADGFTIVGTGIDPSGQSVGWVATIPEPAVLPLVSVHFISLRRRRTTRC